MTQPVRDRPSSEDLSVDLDDLVIEDDTPVDNFQSAQQQRLLVDPLCSGTELPRPFIADANVGIFYQLRGEPIVPDMFLSLGVQRAADFAEKRDRTYLVWEFGKVPEVCIEVVSNREGNELGRKKAVYAQIGVPYYVVFDPLQRLQRSEEMAGTLVRVWSISPLGYTELTEPSGLQTVGQPIWLERVGLGLTLWTGTFEEEVERLWLRWCDRQGTVIPTGAERAIAAETRAQTAETRAQTAEAKAQRLADRLRTLGIDPDQV